MIFYESLIGEVKLYLAVGEEDKCRRRYGRLSQVVDFHVVACWHRSAVEIHLLQKAIDLSRSNTFAALTRDVF